MIRRKKHDSNEDNFWLSATDMMAGILLVVLLLLILFVLYLNQSKDEVFTPLDATEYLGGTEGYRDDYPYSVPPTEHYEYDDNEDSTSGSDTAETQEPIEEPTRPPQSGGDDEEGYDKAAVFVTVVDADTGNTIKKSGIEFELYADKNGIGGLQTLHTYYPIKTEYKKYDTNDRGTFYLPEKITSGWYSLHNLIPPEGYYSDENTDFEIDDYWDWAEPFMVTVEMKPIKKTIRITAEDADTKDPVENAVYKVVASEDITSADGTVRIPSGEEVDEITTDAKGYAESRELYLGNYHLVQTSAPLYYAVNSESVAASVNSASDGGTGLLKLDCHKTVVTVKLTDERTEEPIEGAVYTMEGREDLVTDAAGRIEITDLEKSSSYSLKAASVPEGYLKKDSKLDFAVDGDGLINNSFAYQLDDTAYTLSLAVDVKDLIFSRTVVGMDLTLVDEDGTVVDEWTSGDKAHIITGLAEGKYYIRRVGSDENEAFVNIRDSAELQSAQIVIWDTIDLYALLMTAGAVILMGLILVLLINRRKKANRTHE